MDINTILDTAATVDAKVIRATPTDELVCFRPDQARSIVEVLRGAAEALEAKQADTGAYGRKWAEQLKVDVEEAAKDAIRSNNHAAAVALLTVASWIHAERLHVTKE